MFSSAQQDASQLRSLIKANGTRMYFVTIYIERLPSYQVTERIHSYFRSERERLEMVHKLLARIPEVSLSIPLAPNTKCASQIECSCNWKSVITPFELIS